jgi:putative flippase GtrA
MSSPASIRFIAVGALVYVFDTGLLWLLVRLAGLSLPVGTSIAYVAGVALHFVLSWTYTFADSAASRTRRTLGYLAMLAVNYLITLAVVLGLQTYVLDNVVVAKTTAVATTAVTGYFGLRRLAFPRPNCAVADEIKNKGA